MRLVLLSCIDQLVLIVNCLVKQDHDNCGHETKTLTTSTQILDNNWRKTSCCIRDSPGWPVSTMLHHSINSIRNQHSLCLRYHVIKKITESRINRILKTLRSLQAFTLLFLWRQELRIYSSPWQWKWNVTDDPHYCVIVWSALRWLEY